MLVALGRLAGAANPAAKHVNVLVDLLIWPNTTQAMESLDPGWALAISVMARQGGAETPPP